MGPLASLSVTMGIIAASISLLAFDSVQLLRFHPKSAKFRTRPEGVFAFFLVLFGTIMVFLYASLLALALFAQIQRIIASVPV